MWWIEEEVVRQGAARIVSHARSYRPWNRRDRFQLDNGLYVTTVLWIEDSLVYQYTLMGRADGTIVTPGAAEHAKFERAFRGYRQRVLERSPKPFGLLPPDIAGRLAQVTAALSCAGWRLVLSECTNPGLLERGFPAWRVVEFNVGGPRLRSFRSRDYPGFAGRILSQVDEMRRLLEDVRTWASKAVPGPR